MAQLANGAAAAAVMQDFAAAGIVCVEGRARRSLTALSVRQGGAGLTLPRRGGCLWPAGAHRI